jgi:hypothetical protein
MYRYFVELQAPKEWFNADANAVLALYGAKYAEDLYFVQFSFFISLFCVAFRVQALT